MNNESNERLTKIAFEAAKRNSHSLECSASKKDILYISDIIITPEMEVESEYLEELIPMSQKHKERFCRILVKSPFESGTENIYEVLSKIKFGDVSILKESTKKSLLEYYQERLDIANALLVCKTDTNGINISSAILNCKLPVSLKKILECELEKQYKFYRLNYIPMEYEDGKDELEYAIQHPEFDEDGPTGATAWLSGKYGLCYEDFMNTCFGNYPYEEDIEEYISEIEVRCDDITSTQIQNKIKELEDGVKTNKTKGAPRKNQKLHAALIVFSLYGFNNTNPHIKYVYDCLDFFELIEKSVKEGWTNKYSEISYIKSIFKESKKYGLKFKR